MKFLPFFTLLLLFLGSGCTHPPGLSKLEKQKLDPRLQRLLRNPATPPPRLASVADQNGTVRYLVIIHSDDPEKVKQAGIVVNSQVGNRLTALVSLEELRQIVRLPSVRFVESGSKNFPK